MRKTNNNNNNNKSNKLPVQNFEKEIIESLKNSSEQVLVISGSTGSGKSTQIPQIIYDLQQSNKQNVELPMIVCTQPRKVACRNIAKFVSNELYQKYRNKSFNMGGVVGYQVSDDDKSSQNTRIKFVTTGVLLQSIINKQNINKYTHIVLDEVHERTEDIDFLLCLIRQILHAYKNTKLIIMSATVDEHKFARQFSKTNLESAQTRNRRFDLDHTPILTKVIKWIGKNFQEHSNIELTSEKVDSKTPSKDWELAQKMQDKEVMDLTDDKEENSNNSKQGWQANQDPNYQNTFSIADKMTSLLGPAEECNIIQIGGQSHKIDLSQIDDFLEELYLQQTDDTKFNPNLIFNCSYPQDEIKMFVDRQCAKISRQKSSIQKQLKVQDSYKLDDYFFEIILETLIYVELNFYQNTNRFKENQKTSKGSILIFMPGIFELLSFKSMITNKIKSKRYLQKQNIEQAILESIVNNLYPIIIHSTLTQEEQDLIFEHPPYNDQRKVVIATNIAESSITLPDVTFIIDSCLIKDSQFNQETDCTQLQVKFASKASLNQRKGRTGRVGDGFCLRMITQKFEFHYLNEFNDPEILRCQIERVILKVKISNVGETLSVISDLIDSPKDENIGYALKNLLTLGAISLPTLEDPTGKVTLLGSMMGSLPCDINLTRMMVSGFSMGCLVETVVIAAIQGVDRDLFTTYNQFKGLRSKIDKIFGSHHLRGMQNLRDMDQPDIFECQKFSSKLKIDNDDKSDQITLLKVFQQWLSIRKDLSEQIEMALYSNDKNVRATSQGFNFAEKSNNDELEWAQTNMINLANLRQVQDNFAELIRRVLNFPQFGQVKYTIREIDPEMIKSLKLCIMNADLNKFNQIQFNEISNHYKMNIDLNSKNNTLYQFDCPSELQEIFKTEMELNIYKIIDADTKMDIQFNHEYKQVKFVFKNLSQMKYRILLNRNESISNDQGNKKKLTKDQTESNFIEIFFSKIKQPLIQDKVNSMIKNFMTDKFYKDFKNFAYFDEDNNNNYNQKNDDQENKKLIIKFPRFSNLTNQSYEKTIINIKSQKIKIQKLEPESVCNSLVEDKQQQQLQYFQSNEKPNQFSLKTNTIIDQNYQSLNSIFHQIQDNNTFLIYDYATNSFNSISNKYNVQNLSYILDSQHLKIINEMNNIINCFKSNNKLNIFNFSNYFKFILDQKSIEANNENLFCMALFNQIQRSNKSDLIVNGNTIKLKELNQHKFIYCNIIRSREFDKWLEDCHNKSKKVQSAVQSDIVKFNDQMIQQSLVQDEKFISQINFIKSQIQLEKKFEITKTNYKYHKFGYKNHLDFAIICKKCQTQLFEIQNVQSINCYDCIKIRYAQNCKYEKISKLDIDNEIDDFKESDLQNEICKQYNKVELKNYLVCPNLNCRYPIGAELNYEQNGKIENDDILIPYRSNSKSNEEMNDNDDHIVKFNFLIVTNKIENFELSMFKNNGRQLQDQMELIKNEKKSFKSSKCHICVNSAEMSAQELFVHRDRDDHKKSVSNYLTTKEKVKDTFLNQDFACSEVY